MIESFKRALDKKTISISQILNRKVDHNELIDSLKTGRLTCIQTPWCGGAVTQQHEFC